MMRGLMASLIAAAATLMAVTLLNPAAAAQERTAVAKAEALAAAPVRADVTAFEASAARAVATEYGDRIPLPAGGTFSGIQWEAAAGRIEPSLVDGVLQYNAFCQWLRAHRAGRDPDSGRILAFVLEWPGLRDTDAGAAARLAVGSPKGPEAVALLQQCDESNAREAAYARANGLPVSG